MKNLRIALASILVAACGGGMTTDGGGTDSPSSGGCSTYCAQITTNCTGDNAQYADMADCLSYCSAAAWPAGMAMASSGNTLACRIYHSGMPAMGDPAMHCPHGGPTGADVCGTIAFRSEAPPQYTQVDRMGMPAVSTALIGEAMKEAYNDADPLDMTTGDASLRFVPELAAGNTALHTTIGTPGPTAGLDDDLTAATLTPCSMVTLVGGLPECFGQEVAAGVSVASLVVPDTLQINPAAPAGFPNGRRLEDPVIDVTLAIILLRMGAPCGAGTCSPATLATAGINPGANDVTNLTEFPYFAPPHAP